MTKKLTIEQLLGKTFDNDWSEPTAQDRADFVFHMTDWKSDLETLFRLYNDPGMVSRKEAHMAVFGFLAHVTPHLMAAGRLLLGYEVSNPFDMDKAARAEMPETRGTRTKTKKAPSSSKRRTAATKGSRRRKC
jgi:hypothetical protein